MIVAYFFGPLCSVTIFFFIQQADLMSSGVTRNSEDPQIIYAWLMIPRSPLPFHSLLQHLTRRPTWPADQPAQLASASQPGGPVPS